MTLEELVAEDRLSLHTYAVRSNDFKASLLERGLPGAIRREYALARLPRFVWVVEAIDRKLRQAGRPCVVGECRRRLNTDPVSRRVGSGEFE
jgi:hypothetical protein